MNLEDRTQAAIVDWIRVCAPGCLVFHVPNGGLRSKREASRFKWIGVVAGIPDLIIWAPGGRTYTIEVKAPEGVLRKNQKTIAARMNVLEIPRCIARSIDDVRAAFAQWGLETREAA